jgi:hypothetical protein
MISTRNPCIETVVVQVNGKTLDSVTFANPGNAEAYKRSVRQWASERGVIARVFTEVAEVSRQEHEPSDLPMPSLALA